MTPQQSIAHYRVSAKLGEGGMGEVWRATDTKLNRDVAIKLLPATFAADPDRMARFTREAQVLASINHPNIAAIYGVEERALVLELVEGLTLADRIARGAMPLEEALPIAVQIAEGLEYAHEKGIIHRDLKPANIKITPEGRVKILDFGLAKAMSSDAAPSGDAMASPTLTMRATMAGTIMGTAAYMSPEQARGQVVDRRSDIWAFGVVLHEMLTGRTLFAGPTISDTLAAVLKTEPDVAAAPAQVRPVVERCLRKDPRRRWRDIGDVRVALEEPHAPAEAPVAAPRTHNRAWVVGALAGILAAGGLGWFAALLRQPVIEERPLNLQISPPAGSDFAVGVGASSVISPDARTVAMVVSSGTDTKLWVRPLSGAARELPGTEGAQSPFWSPDSRSIGFFAGGKLKRIEVGGGAPLAIADAGSPRGGAWNQHGTILFATQSLGMRRVSALGGTPIPLKNLVATRAGIGPRWPQFLPDGKRFLYYLFGEPSTAGIYLGSLDGPTNPSRLMETTTNGSYIPPRGPRPGYLLWLRQGALTAQPFQPDQGRFSGEPFMIPGGETIASNNGTGHADVSIAHDGTLLFNGSGSRFQPAWFDRHGAPREVVGRPDRYVGIRLSPDGARVVASILDGLEARDLWTLDLARGLPTRLTTGGTGGAGIWSPDGQRIYFHGLNGVKISELPSTGLGEVKTILNLPETVYANDITPDGRQVICSVRTSPGGFDLLSVPTDGGKPASLMATPFNEYLGQVSPDGKWIAYISDESARDEIYIRSFPSGGTKMAVSSGGGSYPRWRKDGKELFYVGPTGTLMALSVQPAADGLRIGPAAPLPLTVVITGGAFAYPFDVSPDGQRFLLLTPPKGERDVRALTVLINWEAALKK